MMCCLLCLSVIYVFLLANFEVHSIEIINPPKSTVISTGKVLKLQCGIKRGTRPKFKWIFNKTILRPDGKRILINSTSGTLTITTVTDDDFGKYQCQVSDGRHTTHSDRASVAKAMLGVEFLQDPKDQTVELGKNVEMFCNPPYGLTYPTVSWRRNGVTIIKNRDRRFNLDHSGKLIIIHAKKGDSGTYDCVATNEAGQRYSRKAIVDVLFAPEFISMPSNQEVNLHDNKTFDCIVDGNPKPVVSWTRKEASTTELEYLTTNSSLLRLTNIAEKDEGVYHCHAVNKVGTVLRSFYLDVLDKKIVVSPKEQVVQVGKRASFKCETDHPIWSQKSTGSLFYQNSDTHNRIHNKDGELIIKNVQKIDRGWYQCSDVDINYKVRLEVREVMDSYPPLMLVVPFNQTAKEGDDVLIPCQVQNTLYKVSIHWEKDDYDVTSLATLLKNGSLLIKNVEFKHRGAYICVASSETGLVKKSAYLSVVEARSPLQFENGLPSAPYNLITDFVNESKIGVQWKHNSDQLPITSFRVEYFSRDFLFWKSIDVTSHKKHAIISHLKIDQKFYITVRAVTPFRMGLPSPILDGIVTFSSVTHNSAIQEKLYTAGVSIVSVFPNSSQALLVAWRVAAYQEVINGFHLIYQDENNADEHPEIIKISSRYQRSALITGLTPFTLYSVCIQAYNDPMFGHKSKLKLNRTGEALPSSPPLNIKIVPNISALSVVLAWDQPPVQFQNGIIIGYYVWLFENNLLVLNYSVANDNLTTTLNHVPIGREIGVKIAARNSVGIGTPSSMVYFTLGGAAEKDFVSTPYILTALGGVFWLLLLLLTAFLYYYSRRLKKRRRDTFKARLTLDSENSLPHHNQEGSAMWGAPASYRNGPDVLGGNNQIYVANSSDSGRSVIQAGHGHGQRYVSSDRDTSSFPPSNASGSAIGTGSLRYLNGKQYCKLFSAVYAGDSVSPVSGQPNSVSSSPIKTSLPEHHPQFCSNEHQCSMKPSSLQSGSQYASIDDICYACASPSLEDEDSEPTVSSPVSEQRPSNTPRMGVSSQMNKRPRYPPLHNYDMAGQFYPHQEAMYPSEQMPNYYIENYREPFSKTNNGKAVGHVSSC